VAPELGLSIAFPGTPIRQEYPGGNGMRLYTYDSQTPDAELSVRAAVPERKADVGNIGELLDQSVAMMGNRPEDVVRDKRRDIQGHPARELEFQNAKGAAAILLVGMDDFICVITVKARGGDAGAATVPHEQVRAFFDSLTFVARHRPARDNLPPEAVWKEFSPPGRGFIVRFPRPPTEQPLSRKDVTGTLWSSDEAGLAYSLLAMRLEGVAVFSPESLDQLLEAQAAQGAGLGKVEKSERFRVGGLLARELTVQGEGGCSIMRFVVSGPDVFQLSVMAVGMKSLPPEANKFLESFRLAQ
jgi:hypothetical protein